MMDEKFDIQEYMTNGVKRIVGDAVRATIKNPKEALFMARFAKASRQASAKRLNKEKNGEHIPPFLIASITSSCNLHCAGCYSRTNHACSDEEPYNQLTDKDWEKIFSEASELGISFILLAGGEPLLRQDVIKMAANYDNILFPVFTNGFFVGEKYLELFDQHRNLIPILSIEGNREVTDERRGEGAYDRVLRSMESMKARDLIFGASVTVTTENMNEVYSEKFIEKLQSMGCKAVIFVEFVPVTEESNHLALSEEQREYIANGITVCRERFEDMVFIAFPGDEKSSGGCVAAGRGFFHINSHGAAEPCPFSPYSDINVRETSISEALKSGLFAAIQREGLLKDEHVGGCTLFMNREKVKSLV